MILEQILNNYILRNRYTLLLSVIVSFILLVVVEGVVTKRESQVYSFENPYFELNLNNFEGFEERRRLRDEVRSRINR